MADHPDDLQSVDTPPQAADQHTHGSVAVSDEAFYETDDQGPLIQGHHSAGDQPLIHQAGRANRQEPLVDGEGNDQGPLIQGHRGIAEPEPAAPAEAFHEADDQGPLVSGNRRIAEPEPAASAEAFHEADDQGPLIQGRRSGGEQSDDADSVAVREAPPTQFAGDGRELAEASADAADARERRLEDLSHDHLDQGGKATPGTRREAEVGLGMEEQGRLPPPIRRPMPGEGLFGDFVDGAEQSWDVKRFPSREILQEEIRAKAQAAGKPEPTHLTPETHVEGEFELGMSMENIRGELRSGENVIVDGPSMNADDRRSLEEAIRAEGLEDEVLFYDE
jgi:hypothetical protein